MVPERTPGSPAPVRSRSDSEGAAFEAEQKARLALLLTQHYRAIWRAVLRLGVPSAHAEDAAQEVFIVAARKLDSIEPGGEKRFLYGVAVRVAANRRRGSAVRHERADHDAVQEAPAPGAHPDLLLEQKRRRELLERVLGALNEDLRVALVLFEIEGFSERQIADICEIPLGTVASRLRRARVAFHRAAAELRRSLAGEPT